MIPVAFKAMTLPRLGFAVKTISLICKNVYVDFLVCFS